MFLGIISHGAQAQFSLHLGVAWISGWSQQWHLGNPGESWLNNVLVK